MPRERKHKARLLIVDEPAAPATWKQLVRYALAREGGTASLHELYEVLRRRQETRTRVHWQAKVRQTLQASAEFVRVGPGTWSFASLHSPEEISKFETRRRELYPRRTQAKS